jgi:fermentation-respiration switch protein FrsA (DUF1100 family)
VKLFKSKILNIILVILACLLFALYLFLAPRFHPDLVNQIAFHPAPEPPDADSFIGGYGGERLTIDNRLSAVFFKNPDSKLVCIYSHGNADSMIYRAQKADAIKSAGLSVLMYDYSGYGKSLGNPSFSVVIDDGKAVYDYVVNTMHYKPSEVVLYGESIGGGVSSEIARHGETGALFLDSTFLAPATWAKDRLALLRLYPDTLILSPSLSIEALLSTYKGAVLVLKPGTDEVIPTTHSDRLFALAKGQKQIVLLPHSIHGIVDNADFALYRSAMKTFVSDYLLAHH